MSGRKRFIQQSRFVLPLCFLIFGVSGSASAQSVWQKMKRDVLQQQCQQGFQKACQSLAQLKQKEAQQGAQQPGQPPTQSPPSGPQQQQLQGKRVADSYVRCSQISNSSPDSMPRVIVYNPTPAQFGNLILPPVGVPGGENCKTFVYLQAIIGITGTSTYLNLSIYDLGMALNAGLRTQAVIRGLANAEAQQAQQQQKKIDKTAVPSF